MKARFRFRLALALVALVGVGACVDGRDPTGLDLRPTVALGVLPSFAVQPTEAEFGVLSRGRIVATNLSTGEVLGKVDKELNPSLDEWTFELEIVLPAAKTYQIVITVELLSDVVEWSGKTAPIALTAGTDPVDLKNVAMLRGPLDNLGVTEVVLSEVPGLLPEGLRGQARATQTGGGEGAVIFFSTPTPDLLEVDRNGAFRAIKPGTALLEARAGAVADTAVMSIEIIPVGDGDVEAVAGGVDDSLSRLAPALQDAAGAQAIVDRMSDFETAMRTRRVATIMDAVDAAREALAAYGNEELRRQDGPELSLIGHVLDYTERVVLAGLAALTRSK